MSEDEWMYRNWPKSMLELITAFTQCHPPRWEPRDAERRLRLVSCAACRKIERLLDEPRRHLVDVAESYALGRATPSELAFATASVGSPPEPKGARTGARYYADRALAGLPDRAETVIGLVLSASLCDPDQPEPLADYCAGLLRCLFGNPFRPDVTISPSWRTDTAVSLARTMYDSREFSAMPILADALQDAGCDDERILDHCRDSQRAHARGCWVVELVLGES